MVTAVTRDSTDPQIRPPAGFSLRQGEIALVLVGLMFLVVQLVIVRHPLGLSQDESNYLAKVDPRVPELYWSQPRAWGMAVLAAPVAVFSPSLTIYRLYFGLLSSAGLIAAFWPWLRVLRPAVAPAAALFFSTIWFTAAFGSLVMPNLYVGARCGRRHGPVRARRPGPGVVASGSDRCSRRLRRARSTHRQRAGDSSAVRHRASCDAPAPPHGAGRRGDR